ncbi:MAG: hypothetical protein WAO98_04320 [Alphaproteobacteria bacterium]
MSNISQVSVISEVVEMAPSTWVDVSIAAKFIYDVYASHMMKASMRILELDRKTPLTLQEQDERSRTQALSQELYEHATHAKIIELAGYTGAKEEWNSPLNPSEFGPYIEAAYPAGAIVRAFAETGISLTAGRLLYKLEDVTNAERLETQLVATATEILNAHPHALVPKDDSILEIAKYQMGLTTPRAIESLQKVLDRLHANFSHA